MEYNKTFDLSENHFFTYRAVFIRKIDTQIDNEFTISTFNSLFEKIVSNSNPEFKYELLRFMPRYKNDILVEDSWTYGRIITENIFDSLVQPGIDKRVQLIDGEFHFETDLYFFKTLDYQHIAKKFPARTSLYVQRTRKEDKQVVNLDYYLIFSI
ncbi:hypothetical protein C8C85_1991 [Flavobacterium sp. 103]|uniref:hypothetical protein n=1 Tax=Flavobacterium sp. 103 TaxID=2135624 RepID=UPI000D5F524B|nr:hypothetical protein [Flavobacterium sp. 103]PVX46165.1 hypothetical protein C8C85_1991 [Flavobacterium sp. 103]